MMKKMLLTGIVMSAFTISSCDEDTLTVGNTLTDSADLFTIVSDTFNVSSKSIVVDSVLSKSTYSFIGKIKDPETGSYITSDYMTQFNILENEYNTMFPLESNIASKDANGRAIADSCRLYIVIDKWQGDSLAAMKLTAYELGKPVEEGLSYYTNFDPEKEGYIREDGIKQNKLFSMTDLTMSDSARNVRRENSSSYYDYISIPLNKEYVDKDGNHYNNYGTYLLRNYYDHQEYYKNSYNFIHNLCPGFYFKTSDGLGVMARVYTTDIDVFYQIQVNDSAYSLSKTFNGSEEILQTLHISHDLNSIKQLADVDTCTYLKTPAGIFTEVTLPVEEIKYQHETDTITSAKISFSRMNSKNELTDELLDQPTNLLMVERDSLYTFFENSRMYDNITSFLATYSKNTYTFNNISTLINHMYEKLQNGGSNYATTHPNWNKVVLVPVETTTSTVSTYYTSSTSVTAVENEMDITSVRLIGGSNNQHAPLKISVIYSKTK